MYLLIEQGPVGVPEAIDALFHVAHDQVLLALRQALLHEGAEVAPLHPAGVLKLVDHVMVDLRAGFLIDKGGVAALDHLAQQFVGVGDEHDVVLRPVGTDLAGNVCQDAQRIIITDNLLGGEIIGSVVIALNQLFHAVIQSRLHRLDDLPPQLRAGFFRGIGFRLIHQFAEGGGRGFQLSLCPHVEKEEG